MRQGNVHWVKFYYEPTLTVQKSFEFGERGGAIISQGMWSPVYYLQARTQGNFKTERT